ncbi:hypothetical protein [Hymenobacter fodinae]|uniref:Uncharacterized protein n=1 Tax=Hymenobacter fodinae TaxID=2510796 RepID=A0A4Z0P2W1_9BACT|nr:hypothetical protein [Hymenobacter fodinae]TGE05591.1 hypothetical protein EU556_20025 [Hymenobacter fodinae]
MHEPVAIELNGYRYEAIHLGHAWEWKRISLQKRTVAHGQDSGCFIGESLPESILKWLMAISLSQCTLY